MENYQLEAGEEASYLNGGKTTEFILINHDVIGQIKIPVRRYFRGFSRQTKLIDSATA